MSIIDNALGQCLVEHGIADGVVVVGVSGGVDSMVLADALVQAAPIRGLQVVIAHANHALRVPHSDADEAFVRQWAQERQCDFVCERTQTREHPSVPDIGIEAVARNLRYEMFLRVAKEHKAMAVFTAHTRNDNVETFLLQATRGTGYKGLASIPRMRMLGSVCPLLRPLLDCSRHDVQDYADVKGLPWRDDHTNDSLQYTRNRVRHQVLPALQDALGVEALQGIHTTTQNMTHVRRALDVFLDPLRSLVVSNGSSDAPRSVLDVSKLQSLHIDVCRLLLLDVLHCTADDVERLLELLHSQSGSRATLHHGIAALREREHIIVGAADAPAVHEAITIEDFGTTRCGDQWLTVDSVQGPYHGTYSDDVALFDADSVGLPLVWRPWLDGDRISPFGMNGASVLVSDILTNLKVPHETRRSVRVLTQGSSILWICGLRRSDSAPVTPSTRRLLRCRYGSDTSTHLDMDIENV